MTEIVGVRFKKIGKTYYFSPAGKKMRLGQRVIVETVRGTEIGEISIENRQISEDKIIGELKPIIRIATDADEKKVEENRKKEKEAFEICAKKIKAHGMDMKLIAAEYTFDMGKLLFYFTADGRVDFRELVKDLAAVFRTRIELRQIGVRDKAKMLGGIGQCGQSLCCATFLDDFQPVSINMAKEQNLSLNPSKISGACGRLMCCLKYEHDGYEYMIDTVPSVGSIVNTPAGKGTVMEAQLLKGMCKICLDSAPESPKLFHYTECEIVKPAPKRETEPASDDLEKQLND